MDALTLLKKQHREAEQLFQKVKEAEGLDKERAFLQLADELATHASIEEKVFYPSVMSDPTEEDLREAVQEHLEMKRTLADMLDMETAEPRFDEKLRALEGQVRHHVSEEETELFAKVAREFERDVLEKLGTEMERLATMLRESEPYDELPSQTDEAPGPVPH
jgi:hemerythrin-like domain-containing protein